MVKVSEREHKMIESLQKFREVSYVDNRRRSFQEKRRRDNGVNSMQWMSH